MYCKKIFDKKSGFPVVEEAIKINNDMHVYFQNQGNPAPLPQWFISGRNAILTRYSMLGNFPSYLGNIYFSKNVFINEMNQIWFYKARGCPPYSTSMIRFALLLCYTFPQAYCLFLEHFPLPSNSLLKQLTKEVLTKLKLQNSCLKK